jgi:glutamate-1-semialdehyde 2,1-aminomutase
MVSKLPFIDQVRFLNSGTEAVMTALRIARGYTKREKILKFEGCYHGHLDSMLIRSGSGLAGEGESTSAGVGAGMLQQTLVCPLNDEAALEKIFAAHGHEIAAIILEPLPANYGLLKQNVSFLKFLRQITHKHGSLLIFDEVISGFRVAFGGMAELSGVIPDLITYGKVIGAGMPVGAVAGKRTIMEMLAPVGPVYQAGTLSANPVAMRAGLAQLEILSETTFYPALEKLSQKVEHAWRSFFETRPHYGHPHIIREGSLFWFSPSKNTEGQSVPTPQSITQFPTNIMENFVPLFINLLDAGIYLAPNAYEVGFVSMALADAFPEFEKRLAGTK